MFACSVAERSRLLLAASSENLAEAAQMLGQQLLQSIRLLLIDLLEVQRQHITVLALRVDVRRDTDILDLAEIELPFFPQEVTLQSNRLLGPPLRPGTANTGYTQRNGVTRVPAHFDVGFDFAYQLQQTRQ